jgi:hypothetical protein
VARLGVPFKIVDNDLIPFRLEVATRIAALNTAIGWPADASIAAADRARVRTQVAREFFTAEHGREPVNARELAGADPLALVVSGELLVLLALEGQEATVKVYGVAVAMPQFELRPSYRPERRIRVRPLHGPGGPSGPAW